MTHMITAKKLLRLSLFCLSLLLWLPHDAAAAWQPQVKVGLSSGQTGVNLSVSGAAGELVSGDEIIARVPIGQNIAITWDAKGMLVNGQILGNGTLQLRPATAAKDAVKKGKTPASSKQNKQKKNAVKNATAANPSQKAAPADAFRVRINGTVYRGSAEVLHKQNGLTIVNALGVEDYLRGVIPIEMSAEWPDEALKAQTIAARTFALKNRSRHKAEGYDICATTHCQSYRGVAVERAPSDAAVADTRGLVLTYDGSLIDALFHTDSGGMTEDSEAVWGTKLPYLRAVREPEVETQPWTITLPQATVSARLSSSKGAGRKIGDIKKIELGDLHFNDKQADMTLGRTRSGRVRTAIFIGRNESLSITGNELRKLFGLHSTMFTLKLEHDNVVFQGYGSGHGLGLSQFGAKRLADKGETAAQILKHYYTGVDIKNLY